MPREEHVDFKHMDIPTLEMLVGRKATDVKIKGKWVECLFAGVGEEKKTAGSPITVSFKQW